MTQLKLFHLFGIIFTSFSLLVVPHQAEAQKAKVQSEKEKLVLMPLRVPDEDKSLTGAMETALVNGLQRKYDVYSGEQVSQKAHEIFMKENHNAAHRECDETKCMQNIAMAFQAELIATANVTKQDGTYFLALSVRNIFDNKVVQSESLPCEKCTAAQAIEKLKILAASNEIQPAINGANAIPIEQNPATYSSTSNTSAAALDEKNFSSILVKAKSGDIAAQYEIGIMYREGIGVKFDFPKSTEWFGRAVKNGHVAAKTFLAFAYIAGVSVKKDVAKAKKLFSDGSLELEKQAANGDPIAQYELGKFYIYGTTFTEKDIKTGIDLFENAAKQGFAHIQAELGNLYMTGYEIPANYEKAYFWLEKAASQGNKNGQYLLGNIYDKGYGVAKNLNTGFEWYQKAAIAGDDNAQLMLGAIYMEDQSNLENQKIAFQWYMKAARQGNQQAELQISNMFALGVGTNKNESSAVWWLKQAANDEKFDGKAKLMLASRYFNGAGVPQSQTEAFKWYEKAAMQGNVDAQAWMGVMYHNGFGVKKDTVVAYAWANLAMAHGNQLAKDERERIMLSKSQLEEAERLSSGWTIGEHIQHSVK